jgi:glycosyltransferase involved in cell wall biosynthesis
MDSPLVTVLLPTFNVELYVGEAIESILKQTYTNFELFILDDGSTDNTKSIIQGFKDSRIKLLCENENKGIVYQLNKGINLAQGRYIARMDADDVSLPERFKKQVEFLEETKNDRIDVLGTDAISIGLVIKFIAHKNYSPKQISFLLNFYCPILHPTVMMRKSIFDNSFRYSEDFKYAEDYALWRLIDNGSNLAILPDQLLEYRIHSGQTNQNLERKKIQMESCLKIGKIKSIRYLDNILLSSELNSVSIAYWFNVKNNTQPNLFQRNYIRFMKKHLSIKSELLNRIIYK